MDIPDREIAPFRCAFTVGLSVAKLLASSSRPGIGRLGGEFAEEDDEDMEGQSESGT